MKTKTLIFLLAAIWLLGHGTVYWAWLETAGIAPVSDYWYTWAGYFGFSLQLVLISWIPLKIIGRATRDNYWKKIILLMFHWYAIFDAIQMIGINMNSYNSFLAEVICTALAILWVLLWLKPRAYREVERREQEENRKAEDWIG